MTGDARRRADPHDGNRHQNRRRDIGRRAARLAERPRIREADEAGHDDNATEVVLCCI